MITLLSYASFALALSAPQECPLHQPSPAPPTGARSPYAGESTRPIKALFHLEVRPLLTPEQIEQYVSLRGYGHDGH